MSDNICIGCGHYRTAKIVCVGDREEREICACSWLSLEILEIVIECDAKEEVDERD